MRLRYIEPARQPPSLSIPELPASPFPPLEGVSHGDSLDWKEIPADEIVSLVTGKVQPGSIVLFHNAALHTPEALPTIWKP